MSPRGHTRPESTLYEGQMWDKTKSNKEIKEKKNADVVASFFSIWDQFN